MSKKRSLCFVDDDPAELARFKRAVGSQFVVGAGTTLTMALEDLKAQGRRRVDLYVLDMYFPNEGMNTPEELSKLGKAWDAFCTAEDALKSVLAELGQNFAGGRALATQITSRSLFTRKPFVFFTRKGNLLDAIEAYERTGALSVIKKPNPRQPVDEAQRTQAYDDAMVDNRDFLIRALESAIHRGGLWYEYKAEFLAFFVGVASSALVGFITGWLKG
jgi:response regulator RpfG family c-di-GMP phosphodiesterase